jgi:hypothetical protein
VVIGDKLLPVFLPQLETRREIGELWAVFQASKPSSAEKDRLTGAWVAALDRVRDENQSDLYDYIELAAEMCSALDHAPAEERLERALDDFEENAFTNDDVAAACSLLERSFRSTLSSELQKRFRAAATNLAAELLSEHANELNFEDVQSLDEALHSYGDDATLVSDATRAAMTKIARNVDDEIRGIDTVEDLDAYEEALIALMKKRNCPTAGVEQDIQFRREMLLEDGRIKTTSSYRSLSFDPEDQISTSDIRSMFRGLAKS